MNKDEAEKCLELGRKFLRAGDHGKAIKFLDKSLRLYPLPGVKELKARAEAAAAAAQAASGGSTSAGGGSSASASASSSSSSGNGEAARRRHPAGAGGSSGGHGSSGACRVVCLGGVLAGLMGRCLNSKLNPSSPMIHVCVTKPKRRAALHGGAGCGVSGHLAIQEEGSLRGEFSWIYLACRCACTHSTSSYWWRRKTVSRSLLCLTLTSHPPFFAHTHQSPPGVVGFAHGDRRRDQALLPETRPQIPCTCVRTHTHIHQIHAYIYVYPRTHTHTHTHTHRQRLSRQLITPTTQCPPPFPQPDKNAAPDADEAFKAISTAFTTLSDPEKRRAYDQFGDEDGPAAAAARAHPFRHADVTPEEIFNMFFGMHGAAMGAGGRGPGGFRVYRTHGGGHPFGNRYHDDPRRRGHQGRGQGQGQGQQGQQEHPLGVMGQLLQLLPVILLLFLSLFSFPSDGSDRPFSLHRTDRHPVPRETSVEHIYPHIPYYVTTAFDRDYARDRRRLFHVERDVQQAYMYDLHRRCEMERHEKARLVQAARRTFNREERQRKLEEVEGRTMAACDKWESMARG
jgi:hypothetical protein